jgi:hypothetical protein
MEVVMSGKNKHQWWIGSIDGKNHVVSTDKADLPADATPAKIHQPPTKKQEEIITRKGGSVRVWKPRE